jgi:hypothetical protein
MPKLKFEKRAFVRETNNIKTDIFRRFKQAFSKLILRAIINKRFIIAARAIIE